MYFRTNANLSLKQVENLRVKLNELLLEDLLFVIDKSEIVFYTEDELI